MVIISRIKDLASFWSFMKYLIDKDQSIWQTASALKIDSNLMGMLWFLMSFIVVKYM